MSRTNKHHTRKKSGPKKSQTIFLFGQHPVEAALAAHDGPNARPLYTLFVTETNRHHYAALAQEAGVPMKTVDKGFLDSRTPKDQPHQGVGLEVGPLPKLTLRELPESVTRILALDQLTDPRNIGACLRSAAAFGVQAVLVPKHDSGHNSPLIAKAAAGAVEMVPMIEVTNLTQALDYLTKDDFWITGLAGEGETTIHEVDFNGKWVLVMGAEGDGLRHTTRAACDFLARIPMEGVESLNVSVACGIALYEATRA